LRGVRRPIPVIVVAGFLGAGKTTLLNHLLRHPAGARIGVVVNDFGSINIDSMLVAGQVDAMVSLGNGCVCCAVDADELDGLLDRLAADSAVDVIVIEASGLAEPVNLVRMVLGSANPRLRYGGLVEVVDAAHFDEVQRRHPELLSHLRLADLVVLNKIDAVSAEGSASLRARLAAEIGSTPLVATTRGRVDAALLFDPPQAAHRPTVAEQLTLDGLLREHDDAEHDHAHTRYDSVAVTLDGPVHPRRFVEVLERPPAGLYRAKGFVTFAVPEPERPDEEHPDRFVMHFVGRHLMFEPTSSAGSNSELVFIGTSLDEAELRDRLDATAADKAVDANAMLAVYRYARRERWARRR
jgi:cobalamin biosynthesis protein CobW